MKITNKYNMPEILYDAVCARQYSGEGVKKDFSVTELLKPSKQAILMKRHADEVEQDASDLMWSFFGELVHLMLERVITTNPEKYKEYLSENRYFITFMEKIISGGVDLYNKETKTIMDYKYTSAWTMYFNGREEWEQQLNIYAKLLREAGYEVDHLKIITIFRDWQKKMVGIKKGKHEYPQNKFMVIDLPLWSDFEVDYFLNNRLYELESYSKLPDDEIPDCKDKWSSESFFGVYSSGGKCYKKFDTESDAEAWLIEKGYKGCSIKEQKGVDRLCQSYCPVKQFCSYGRALQSVIEE